MSINKATLSLFYGFLILMIGFVRQSQAAPILSGQAILPQEKPITVNLMASENDTNIKGQVFIFMSAKCPCSNSHKSEIKKIVSTYSKQFSFYIVHSNSDENITDTKKYFSDFLKEQNLSVPVIQDENFKWADHFKAYKTPHVFVVNRNGEIIYQGGVTNSAHAPQADKHYLFDILEDLDQNKSPRFNKTRTLGCVILRQTDDGAKSE